MGKNSYLPIAFLLLSFECFAMQSVLISGFDPFDKSRENNSQRIGRQLLEKLQKARPDVDFSYCQLRTVYDKSVQELIDCANSMKKAPDFILSLGETGCGEMKIETSAVNMDLDTSSDNDGIHRDGQPIILGAPQRIGLNLPLQRAWCKLSPWEKNFAKPSKDAGTFVCNNLSYLMASHYPEVKFGFIHVPAHGCFWRAGRNLNNALRITEKLVLEMIGEDIERFTSHPASKASVKKKIKAADACDKEFYSRLL